jgi:hypothetical protein
MSITDRDQPASDPDRAALTLFRTDMSDAPMDADKLRAMANRCRELLEHAGTEELRRQLHQWAEEFDAEADGGREGVDAAELGAVVAEDSRCPPAHKVTVSNGKKPTPRGGCFEDMNAAEEYRRRAAQARRVAKSISDPALRPQMETVADDYEKMADEIERGLANDKIRTRLDDRTRRR